MPALVCFPDAPPLCEFADRGAWERCEGVEGGKAIERDREGEDCEIGGEGEEDGGEWGGKVGEEEEDGPKGWNGKDGGQDRLRGSGLVAVECVVGELWESVSRNGQERAGGRLPGWRQRYRGRNASRPFGCGGGEDWGLRGGYIYEKDPAARRWIGGRAWLGE